MIEKGNGDREGNRDRKETTGRIREKREKERENRLNSGCSCHLLDVIHILGREGKGMEESEARDLPPYSCVPLLW